jgi:adrenodoxin-NADP+ reductase
VVNWYNGHPNQKDLGQFLRLAQVKHVVIVGQGNVAIDCARILGRRIAEVGCYMLIIELFSAHSAFTKLEATDISSHAMEVLGKSAIETISIVGRRGHVQGAFTIKELREVIAVCVLVHVPQ